MRADPLTLTFVFGKDVRYVVPMFQRPYVWNMKEHWEPLWEDIRGVAETGAHASNAGDGPGPIPVVEATPAKERKTDAELVALVIESRAPAGVGRMLAEAVVSEVQSWTSVRCRPGKTTKTTDHLTNYILMHRRDSVVGAFMYVYLKAHDERLHFRLPREYAEGRAHASPRAVAARNVYQVRMKLRSLDHLPEALELARAAFENAGEDATGSSEIQEG